MLHKEVESFNKEEAIVFTRRSASFTRRLNPSQGGGILHKDLAILHKEVGILHKEVAILHKEVAILHKQVGNPSEGGGNPSPRRWESFTRRRQSFTRMWKVLRSRGINIFNETRKKI